MGYVTYLGFLMYATHTGITLGWRGVFPVPNATATPIEWVIIAFVLTMALTLPHLKLGKHVRESGQVIGACCG